MTFDQRRAGDRKMAAASTALSQARREEIRERIETRYYDRPEVVEAVARAILADREPSR